MVKKITLLVSLLFGFALLTGIDQYEQDLYEEDLYEEYLQLQRNENRILAFSGRKPSVAVDLEIGEKVRLSEEKGHVGAVLTNKRFLAISSMSGKWVSEPLISGEVNTAGLTVGEKVAMVVTDRRIIGFTPMKEGFIAYDLPIGTEVRARDAGENFAIVAMSERAVGLSSETGNFRDIEFDIGESFTFLEMATTLALVHTEDNIYAYRGASGTWSIRPKPAIK
ncbi:MAG TPA: hypothetical protein VJ959_04335 [Desulfotignum sp.]|nr:hypothetical protein [Desulfotignum sp.]